MHAKLDAIPVSLWWVLARWAVVLETSWVAKRESRLSIIIDTDLERVKVVYADLGITDIVFSDDKAVLSQAILAGKHTGSTDATLVSELPVDLVVEGTGIPDIGAQITYSSLLAKKDVAVLNVEMDVTIGPLLHKVATDNGVIYAVCHGDEPIEAKVLVDYARDLNFEIICAGKGKNNPFEPLSTPDSVRETAIAKKMNPKMLCSFTDGSKTMTEMVALANTTGLQLSKRGMYGPASSVKTLQDTFALAADGGVLDRPALLITAPAMWHLVCLSLFATMIHTSPTK
jgi:predicted homoserine dehydrogenase-like protein